MNDTIMASVAALKSRGQKTGYSLYTGFRSVRSGTLKNPAKLSDFKTLEEGSCARTTVSMDLDTDVLDRLRKSSDDPIAEIRRVLRAHVISTS